MYNENSEGSQMYTLDVWKLDNLQGSQKNRVAGQLRLCKGTYITNLNP